MKALKLIALVLLIVGGLNWGLVGVFGFNLVETLFGWMPAITRITYTLVGISAIFLIFMLPKIKRECNC